MYMLATLFFFCYFPVSTSCPWIYTIPAAGLEKLGLQWRRFVFRTKQWWSAQVETNRFFQALNKICCCCCRRNRNKVSIGKLPGSVDHCYILTYIAISNSVNIFIQLLLLWLTKETVNSEFLK